jgi:predicted transposase YdaD
VYLEDFAERPATTLGLRLIQLLIGDVRQAVPQAVALLRQTRATLALELSFEQKLELVETILVYRCPHWGREEVKAMLGLDTELKQTRFYREVFAEGETEGELKLLRRLLIRRFGALTVWAEAKLERAELAQLEVWGERMLDATTLDEIFVGGS